MLSTILDGHVSRMISRGDASGPHVNHIWERSLRRLGKQRTNALRWKALPMGNYHHYRFSAQSQKTILSIQKLLSLDQDTFFQTTEASACNADP